MRSQWLKVTADVVAVKLAIARELVTDLHQWLSSNAAPIMVVASDVELIARTVGIDRR